MKTEGGVPSIEKVRESLRPKTGGGKGWVTDSDGSPR